MSRPAPNCCESAGVDLFRVAWLFLLLTAFSGWVFNAFFALALRVWFPAETHSLAKRLFWVLQLANVGIFGAFLVQGYGAVSIAFSTLHLVAALSFVVVLWRLPTVSQNVRPWLRVALACFVLSGIGPLALGPLAALFQAGALAMLPVRGRFGPSTTGIR